jgi:ribosomal protein S20
MPIIKSAKKRAKTARKATARNVKVKRSLKNSLKAFNAKPSSSTHAIAQSRIDTAVKKGLVSKRKASRLKKRVSAQAKSAKVKLAVKSAAVKAAAKKSGAKRTAKKKA